MLSKEQVENRLGKLTSEAHTHRYRKIEREALETALALWGVAEAAKELGRDRMGYIEGWVPVQNALAALEVPDAEK